MPRPIPAPLVEALPASPTAPPATADVLRVLGGIGLPGDTELTRIPTAPGSLPEAVTSWEGPAQAHAATARLFNEIFQSYIKMPELGEFVEAGVDFAGLQAGFEAYERAGKAPQLVFAPINPTVDTWQANFDALCDHQDQINASQSRTRTQTQQLKRQDDGNGLFIGDAVKSAWGTLTEQAVNNPAGHFVHQSDGTIWGAWVIPTADVSHGGLIVNTSHDLSSGDISDEVALLSRAGSSVNKDNVHMPVGTYLTAQAVRFVEDMPFIDLDGNWTWNAGTFNEGGALGLLQAPASYWRPASGQVGVNRDGVGRSDGGLGVRLPVWG